MLTKDIAAILKEGSWQATNKATLYTQPTARIHVVIEEYKTPNDVVYLPGGEDFSASYQDFINTFMNSIGMELSANQEVELVKALVASLKDWSETHLDNKEYVNDLLKSLITE